MTPPPRAPFARAPRHSDSAASSTPFRAALRATHLESTSEPRPNGRHVKGQPPVNNSGQITVSNRSGQITCQQQRQRFAVQFDLAWRMEMVNGAVEAKA